MSSSVSQHSFNSSGCQSQQFTKPGVPVSHTFDSGRQNPYDLPKFDRRDAYGYFYIPVDCPLGRKCSHANCPLAHTKLEKIFHPIVYKTQPCQFINLAVPDKTVERNGLSGVWDSEQGYSGPSQSVGSCEYMQKCAFYHNAADRLAAEQAWKQWEKKWEFWRPQIDQTLITFGRDSRETRRKVEGILKLRMPRNNGPHSYFFPSLDCPSQAPKGCHYVKISRPIYAADTQRRLSSMRRPQDDSTLPINQDDVGVQTSRECSGLSLVYAHDSPGSAAVSRTSMSTCASDVSTASHSPRASPFPRRLSTACCSTIKLHDTVVSALNKGAPGCYPERPESHSQVSKSNKDCMFGYAGVMAVGPEGLPPVDSMCNATNQGEEVSTAAHCSSYAEYSRKLIEAWQELQERCEKIKELRDVIIQDVFHNWQNATKRNNSPSNGPGDCSGRAGVAHTNDSCNPRIPVSSYESGCAESYLESRSSFFYDLSTRSLSNCTEVEDDHDFDSIEVESSPPAYLPNMSMLDDDASDEDLDDFRSVWDQ